MQLAARTAAWAKSGGGWVNPYVTDGLVAMWDGEWNAGGGVHESAIQSVPDLSGNGHTLHFSTGFEVGTDYFRNTQNNNVSTIDGVEISNLLAGGYTICCVGGHEDTMIQSGDTSLISFHVSDSFYLSSYSTYTNTMAFSKNAITYYAPSAVYKGKIFAIYFTSLPKLIINNTNGSVTSYSPKSVGGFSVASNGSNIQGASKFPATKIKFKSIRVYSRELTDSEISTMWEIDRARFNLPDVIIADDVIPVTGDTSLTKTIATIGGKAIKAPEGGGKIIFPARQFEVC